MAIQTPRSDPRYDASYYRGGARSHYVEYAQAEGVAERYWLPLIERYRGVQDGTESGRMLDVGCAYGFLVQAYRRRGWKAEGCDVSAYAIEEGRRRGIDNLHLGSVTDLDPAPASYDLVTCLDVIEHLDHGTYREYVGAFHRLLRPGGVLFVATPNRIDCSGYNVFSPDWVEGDETHVNYRSIRELAHDFAAFERVVIHGATPFRGMFDSFRPFRWFPRLANGLIRWFLWRLLGNDPHHSVYLLLVARR